MVDDHEKRINNLEREQAVQSVVLHEMSKDLVNHSLREESFHEKVLLSLDTLNEKISAQYLAVIERVAVLEAKNAPLTVNKKTVMAALTVIVAALGSWLGLS